jgi:hypothetical protein
MIIDFGLPKNCMILSSVNNPQYNMKQTIEQAANDYLQSILESSDYDINFEVICCCNNVIT